MLDKGCEGRILEWNSSFPLVNSWKLSDDGNVIGRMRARYRNSHYVLFHAMMGTKRFELRLIKPNHHSRQSPKGDLDLLSYSIMIGGEEKKQDEIIEWGTMEFGFGSTSYQGAVLSHTGRKYLITIIDKDGYREFIFKESEGGRTIGITGRYRHHAHGNFKVLSHDDSDPDPLLVGVLSLALSDIVSDFMDGSIL